MVISLSLLEPVVKKHNASFDVSWERGAVSGNVYLVLSSLWKAVKEKQSHVSSVMWILCILISQREKELSSDLDSERCYVLSMRKN